MSKNMVVTCYISDRGLLEEILGDLGVPFTSGANLTMRGYASGIRPHVADVLIDRRYLHFRFGGSPNDLGFRFQNGNGETIISEYDTKDGNPGRMMVNSIMREYARRRVIAQARLHGHEVESIVEDESGGIRIRLKPKRAISAKRQMHVRRSS